MPKKIFISDLDGTLLKSEKNDSKNISIKNIKAIQDFVRDGNSFAVATARGIDYKNELEEILKIKVDYIGNNGACTMIAGKMKVHSIPYELVKQIIKFTLEKNLDVTIILNTRNEFFYIPTNKFPFNSSGRINTEFIVKNGIVYDETFDLEITKVMFFVAENKVLEIKEILMNQFNESLEIVLSDTDIIDMTSKGCNKGKGVLELIETYQLNREQVAVVGDTENDVSMFQCINQSYCMNHAMDHVKKEAAMIVQSVDEALRHFQKKVSE